MPGSRATTKATKTWVSDIIAKLLLMKIYSFSMSAKTAALGIARYKMQQKPIDLVP
jgi:hypothetical protein